MPALLDCLGTFTADLRAGELAGTDLSMLRTALAQALKLCEDASEREQDDERSAAFEHGPTARAEASLAVKATRYGSLRLQGELPAAEGAALLRAVDAEADRFALRAGTDDEPAGARRAEALVRLCRLGASAPERSTASDGARRVPRAEIVLHVSAEALRRGELVSGERCEIDGVGPVPLGTVEYLFGNAFAKVVVSSGADVASVTDLGRCIPAYVDTALRARDRVCAVPSCGISYGLERDHVLPIDEGGTTELDNLVMLCKRHHYLKAHKLWKLVGRPGDWQWVNARLAQPEPCRTEEADTERWSAPPSCPQSVDDRLYVQQSFACVTKSQPIGGRLNKKTLRAGKSPSRPRRTVSPRQRKDKRETDSTELSRARS